MDVPSEQKNQDEPEDDTNSMAAATIPASNIHPRRKTKRSRRKKKTPTVTIMSPVNEEGNDPPEVVDTDDTPTPCFAWNPRAAFFRLLDGVDSLSYNISANLTNIDTNIRNFTRWLRSSAPSEEQMIPETSLEGIHNPVATDLIWPRSPVRVEEVHHDADADANMSELSDSSSANMAFRDSVGGDTAPTASMGSSFAP